MLNSKKVVRLTLALTLAMGALLSGCGSSGEKPAEGNATPEGGGETLPQLEPVKLSWYYFGSSPGNGQAKVEEALNDYLQDKINATIQFYPLGWDEFMTKTGAMAASNEPFDIVFAPSWMGFADNAAKNMYLDITELFPQCMPKTKELLGEDFLKGGYINDRLLAVSTNKEKAHTTGIMFNKQLLDKYGLDVNSIETVNDLEPMLKIIKDAEPDVIPFSVAGGANLLSVLNIDYVSGDDTYPVGARQGDTQIVNIFELPEVVEAFELTRDWYLKGYIPKDAATEAASGDTKKTETLKNDGKVFAYVTNTIPGYAANKSTDKVTWIQKEMTPPVMSNKDLGGSMNAISATSKNPERALMFLELVNTDPVVNNLINWGIEGVHYTKVSDNVIHTIDNSDYMHQNQWIFGNQFINYLKDTESPTKWKEYEEFNAAAIADKSLGFKFTRAEELKTEIAAAKLVFSKVYFQFGAQDVETELPKVIEQFKKAGIDKIIATMQEEYDEWLAKQ